MTIDINLNQQTLAAVGILGICMTLCVLFWKGL